MSDNRSGSTLLDQLLGAHKSIISLGEVHHIRAYALQDRSLYNPAHPLECSCGSTVASCGFWSRIEKQLGQEFENLVLKPRFFGFSEGVSTLPHRVRNFIRRFVEDNPQNALHSPIARLLDGPRVAKDSFALFEAVFDETTADYLIDSSKDPFRFRFLYDHQPLRMRAIMLGRDYRGTVHSKMKRGRSLETGVQTWVRRMRQMKELTGDMPMHQQIRVRYEDLCDDPRAELTRICRFLDLEFSEKMLSRPMDNVHHLGGSPSKFDPSRSKIKLDQSYLDAFSTGQLATMKEIVGDDAADWGY